MRPDPPDTFVSRDFEPAYLASSVTADLTRRAAAARDVLACCQACPRKCRTDRLDDSTGLCEIGRHARVKSAFPHHGEEACLVGSRGSGTIFFSRCNLKCVFCQNADISHHTTGEPLDAAGIAGLMLNLQSAGCHNINFVSPSHVVPQIIEAVAVAVPRGLHLPIVYNSNAYDSLDALRMLDGIVDIYMPDFKFWTSQAADQYCLAADYPQRATAAVKEMHRQVGDLRWDERGIAKRGLLVRHLVMPGLGGESAAILRWLAQEVSPDTFVNIMDQYRPAHRVGLATRGGETWTAADKALHEQDRFPEIDRRPTHREIQNAYQSARDAGLWRFDD